MIYEREYWHYQRCSSQNHKPYAVQLIKQIDTEVRVGISVTVIVYCEDLETRSGMVLYECAWPFTIVNLALAVDKGVKNKGVTFDAGELYDLETFILECLQDSRPARESEIL